MYLLYGFYGAYEGIFLPAKPHRSEVVPVTEMRCFRLPTFNRSKEKDIFVWVMVRRRDTLIEKYMAQSLHIGLYGSSTNLPFGICAIYFDLKVTIHEKKCDPSSSWQ